MQNLRNIISLISIPATKFVSKIRSRIHGDLQSELNRTDRDIIAGLARYDIDEEEIAQAIILVSYFLKICEYVIKRYDRVLVRMDGCWLPCVKFDMDDLSLKVSLMGISINNQGEEWQMKMQCGYEDPLDTGLHIRIASINKILYQDSAIFMSMTDHEADGEDVLDILCSMRDMILFSQ